MDRIREGYTFPCGNIHMLGRIENGKMILMPADEDWQFMFRFMIE